MDQEHTMHQVPAEFTNMQCTVSESLYSRLEFKIHSLMFPHPHSSCTFFFNCRYCDNEPPWKYIDHIHHHFECLLFISLNKITKIVKKKSYLMPTTNNNNEPQRRFLQNMSLTASSVVFPKNAPNLNLISCQKFK